MQLIVPSPFSSPCWISRKLNGGYLRECESVLFDSDKDVSCVIVNQTITFLPAICVSVYYTLDLLKQDYPVLRAADRCATPWRWSMSNFLFTPYLKLWYFIIFSPSLPMLAHTIQCFDYFSFVCLTYPVCYGGQMTWCYKTHLQYVLPLRVRISDHSIYSIQTRRRNAGPDCIHWFHCSSSPHVR